MSEAPKVRVIVDLGGGSTLELHPAELRLVKKATLEAGEWTLRCRKPSGTYQLTFRDVRIERYNPDTSSWELLEKGKILKTRYERWGFLTLEGCDLTWLLRRPAEKKAYEGTADQVISDILKPLVDEGKITLDVAASDVTVRLDLTDRDVSMLEAVRMVCEDPRVGYDAYVDRDGVFHAFPRGSREYAPVPEICEYEVEEDATAIVNSCRVYGAPGKVVPSDTGDFCESGYESLWSIENGSIVLDTEVKKEGGASIRAEPASETDTFELVLPEPLDLNPVGGVRKRLVFWLRFEEPFPEDDVGLQVRLWPEGGSVNEGFVVERVGQEQPTGTWGRDVGGREIPYMFEVGEGTEGPDGWSCAGIWPDEIREKWSKIKKIVFFSDGVKVWIDGLRFESIRPMGYAKDQASIDKYGLSHLELIRDDLESDEECLQLAQAIVDASKEPRKRLLDVAVRGVLDVNPGDKVRIVTPELDEYVIALEVEHELRPDGFYTHLRGVSAGPVPAPPSETRRPRVPRHRRWRPQPPPRPPMRVRLRDAYIGEHRVATESYASRGLWKRTGLLIPMYLYPWDASTGTWKPEFENLLSLMKRYWKVPVYVVINPSNGPGDVEDGVWRRAIKKIHGSGGYVLGYVSTSYTNRSLDEVKADVRRWKKLYPHVDGLFVDEMTNDDDQAHRDYYRELTEYAHDLGFYPVIGNPGAPQLSSYFLQKCADIIVVWETNSYPSESDLEQGDWEDSYREIPWWTRAGLVYGQSSLDVEKFRMMCRHLGLVYVTSGSSESPWSELPSYLNLEFASLAPEADVGGKMVCSFNRRRYEPFAETGTVEFDWTPGEGYEYLVLDYAKAAANAVTESGSVSDTDVKGRSKIDQTVGDHYIKRLHVWMNFQENLGASCVITAVLDDESEVTLCSAEAQTVGAYQGACEVEVKGHQH